MTKTLPESQRTQAGAPYAHICIYICPHAHALVANLATRWRHLSCQMANNCHIGLTSWYWIGVFISESQLSLQTRQEGIRNMSQKMRLILCGRWKWEGMRIGGSSNLRNSVSSRDGRWCPGYYQISSKIPFEKEIPSQISSLCRPSQTQLSSQEKRKTTWRRKSGCWSRWGQNWESVSSWNLSVPQICHSLKFVPPWPVVDWCRLSIKRISTPTVSIIIDTGLASPQIKILGTSNENYLACCNVGSCGLSITFCWKI